MKRVLLAMSGGIDSAVSAILLQDQGYEVVGATMSLHDPSGEDRGIRSGCFGPLDIVNKQMLAKVCDLLNIECIWINLRPEFEREVLNYYRSTYLRGCTPNPCVICNHILKFDLLPRRIRDMGVEFDHFATGHYARTRYSGESERWQLLKAADPLKDQSYFLCLLSQEQLASTLFPLGDLTKDQVRAIAQDRGLDFLLTKAESQDFVKEEDHPLLFDPEQIKPGDMLDPEGNVIGQHRGLIHYTIGQRRHLGISGMTEPWYVTGLDVENNRLSVGPLNCLYKNHLVATNVNWISIPSITEETRAETKIRLAHNPATCTLKPLDDISVEVIFDEPQLSVTPGQFAVFYQGDVLWGGGTIVNNTEIKSMDHHQPDPGQLGTQRNILIDTKGKGKTLDA